MVRRLPIRRTSHPIGPTRTRSESGGLPGARGCTFDADGALRPFTATDQYNFGPVNYFQRPDERYTAGAFANFKMSDRADVYGELMFMDDRSVAQIAPSGSFFRPRSPSIATTRIWSRRRMRAASSAARSVLGPDDFGHRAQSDVATRKVAVARTTSVTSHTAWSRVSVANSPTGFSYDVYFQHGETKRNSTYQNDFSIRRTGWR